MHAGSISVFHQSDNMRIEDKYIATDLPISPAVDGGGLLVLLALPYIDIYRYMSSNHSKIIHTLIYICVAYLAVAYVSYIISYIYLLLADPSQTHEQFSLFSGPPPFPLFYASSAMHHEHLSCPYMYKL